MTAQRRVVAEILVDGDTPSGVVVDEAGRRHPFRGWLELIGLLQPGRELAADDPRPAPREG